MRHEIRKSGAIALIVLGALAASPGVHSNVPLAEDLRVAGRQAEDDCKPLLLEFSALACDYCRLLEREILNPTLLNRDYDRRVLMRKLLIDGNDAVTDFSGKTISGQALATRYKVFVTPTLLFVDASGEELAERMVGVTTLDFYGGYLDLALEASRERLMARPHCRAGAD